MNSYQFTLMINNIDQDRVDLEDSLYQSGCDDALIHFKSNVAYLEFDREANSFEEAVKSAIQDVESISLHCELVQEDWEKDEGEDE